MNKTDVEAMAAFKKQFLGGLSDNLDEADIATDKAKTAAFVLADQLETVAELPGMRNSKSMCEIVVDYVVEAAEKLNEARRIYNSLRPFVKELEANAEG